jgi:general secretion pathway protein B
MSSILKALKRLEHEKASRKPDSFRVDAEILKSGASRRLSSLAAVMAVLVVFICGGSATYFFMKRNPVAAPLQPPAIQRSGGGMDSPVVPEQRAIQPAGQNAPPSDTGHPATVTKKIDPIPQPVARRVAPQFDKPAAEGSPQTSLPGPQSTPTSSTALPASPAKPALKINGIAFQDGGADSLAVVNGTTVSKGSVIEGARVEEIQKDRVRFSRGGDTFDVILDRTN